MSSATADRGFDELPMTIGMLRGGSNSRFRSLLDGLRAEGDLSRQEGALTELCDMLCMATEETLQGFSMDSFLPPLIALINCEVLCCPTPSSNSYCILFSSIVVVPVFNCGLHIQGKLLD